MSVTPVGRRKTVVSTIYPLGAQSFSTTGSISRDTGTSPKSWRGGAQLKKVTMKRTIFVFSRKTMV